MVRTQAYAPVAVDVMGGDHGPKPVIAGAVAAWKQFGIRSILVGNEGEIARCLSEHTINDPAAIGVRGASQVVTMDESASKAVRTKRDSSLRVAFRLVREGEASGVVSAGNTGAMMATGIMMLGVLPGIQRPAIASLLPRTGKLPPVVLLDSGANVDCNAHQLVQFAVMGGFYARSALQMAEPRIALLSNGSEASKGTDILRAAALYLQAMKELHYVGYVEGNDICRDLTDVIVCDGFVGNIVLKNMEGSVKLVIESIKGVVQESGRAKLGMSLVQPALKKLFKNKLDPSSYGGAPLLGLNGNAIVCHGSSSDRAITNGIRVAERCANEELVANMAGALEMLDEEGAGSYEDGLWERVSEEFGTKKSKKSKKKQREEGKEI